MSPYPEQVVADLKEELQKPIESKYQLVYLAVRIRSLIDDHRPPPDYAALKSFLSWPVHGKLHMGWAQKPLEYFHANCETLLGWKTASSEQEAQLKRILSFKDAYEQLLDLLRDSTVGPYSRLFQPSGWQEFMMFYLQAIGTTPLVIDAKPSGASRHCAAQFGEDACLERVTVAKRRHEALPGGGSELRISWGFKLKNGMTKVLVGGIHFAPDDVFLGGRRYVPPNSDR